MGHLFAYSIAVSVVLIPLALLSRFLLSRYTFHRLNRVVVVGSLIASLLLPLCTWALSGVSSGHAVESAGTIAVEVEVAVVTFPASVDGAPLWLRLLTAAYMAGLCVFAVREIIGILSLIRIVRKSREVSRVGRWSILLYPVADVSPMSFWKYIVVSADEYEGIDDAIIIHETAHLEGFHWVDLILADMVAMLCWYCPAAWIMRRQLADIHEYEADCAVSDSGISIKAYQKMLIQKVAGSRLPSFACNFTYHSNISKRIKMMKKNKSNPGLRFVAAAALPVAALGVMALSVPAVANSLSTVSEVKITSKPANVQEDGAVDTGILLLQHPADVEGVASVAEATRPTPAEAVASTPASVQVEDKKKEDVNDNQVAQTPPRYPGGEKAMMQFVYNNLRMPEDALEIPNLSSIVILTFVVTPECTVKDIKVIRHGVIPSLDQAAINAVKDLKFESPAIQDGKPVDTIFSLPISFKLTDYSAKSDSTSVADKK